MILLQIGSSTVGLTPNEVEEFNVGVSDAQAGEGSQSGAKGLFLGSLPLGQMKKLKFLSFFKLLFSKIG